MDFLKPNSACDVDLCTYQLRQILTHSVQWFKFYRRSVFQYFP